MKLANEVLKSISEAATKDKPLSEDITPPDLQTDLENYEVQFLKHQLDEAKATHGLRLKYTKYIFLLVCAWLGFVIISVFFTGFKFGSFTLSDKVLIVFITSTTISVIGLFIIVAHWLFPINNQKKKLPPN